MINDRHREIADFVSASPVLGPYALWPQTVPSAYRGAYPTAAELAARLIEDEEFRALRLATWLSTPDGRLIAEAVGLLVAPVYRQEYELIVGALKIAAQIQYEEGGSHRAGALALGVISAVVSVLVPSARRVAFPTSA